MKFVEILTSLLIILLFVGMYVFSLLSTGLKKIHEKWPEYRCNPMMMPLASSFGPPGTDTAQNFSSCVHSQMKGLMGTLLQPVHYATSLANSMGGNLTTAIQDVRKSFNYVKNMITSIVKKIFSVFMSFLVEILRLIIKMKDLGGKIMGTMAVTLYMISGMVQTGTSIWAGPLGDVVRFLCFHPDTPIVMKNGKMKTIKAIKIGDILINGSEVMGTLTLQGSKINPYYKIYSKKLDKYIKVTGSHLVEDKSTGRFIPVSHLDEAIPTKSYTKSMNCLITDNHLIPIGEYMFWDWEDGN